MDRKDRGIIFKYTFLSSCLTGFICYLYFMANNLDNCDNIACKPSGFGAGLISGRWLLSIIGNIFEKVWYYNSSYFNCILSIIMLGAINILLVYIFKISDKYICILLSSITVVFPAIADTIFFTFTIQYYMIAIILGLIGICFIQRVPVSQNPFLKAGLTILSGGLYACSLGIYQAYFPFIAAVLVLCLAGKCLDNVEDWKKIFKSSLYYLFSLVLGYIIYRVILKICLKVFNRELLDYKGINNMGIIELKQIPTLLYKTYSSYILLFKEDFVSISGNLLAKIIILSIYLFVFISLFFIWKKCSKLKFIELCVFIAILPLASNAIIIMVPESDVRTMMSLGTVSVFYLPLIFLEKTDYGNWYIKNNKMIKIFASVLVLAILNYTWLSNVNYSAMYYSNKKLENYLERLYCRIESVEGYNEDMPVIFVGKNITDAAFIENWTDMSYYGGNFLAKVQMNLYSRDKFILNYLGRDYLDITEEQYRQYKDEIDQMDKYPNDKSIKVIDGSVFVKLE